VGCCNDGCRAFFPAESYHRQGDDSPNAVVIELRASIRPGLSAGAKRVYRRRLSCWPMQFPDGAIVRLYKASMLLKGAARMAAV